MKLFSLVTTIFALIFVSWVVSVWTDSDRICLESGLVSELQIVDANGNLAHVPQCYVLSLLIQPHLKNEDLQLLRQAVGRIEKMQSVLLVMPRLRRPIELQIDLRNPFLYKKSGDLVQLGGAWAQEPQTLEKVIIFEMLRSKHPVVDRFALEVVADFFVSVHLNSWSLQSSEYEFPSLISHLVSFKEYCYSNLKSMFHWEYCANQNSLLGSQSADESTVNDLTIWSLRSYLAFEVWNHYRLLPIHQKQIFFKKLVSNLSFNQIAYPQQVSSVLELYDWVDDFLMQLGGLPSHKPHFPSVAATIDSSGLPQEVSDQLASSLLKKNAKAENDRELLLIQGSKLVHYPSLRALTLPLPSIKMNFLVLPSCRIYQFDELNRSYVDQVVVIDNCNSEFAKHWDRIIDEQVGNFQSDRRKYSFLNPFKVSNVKQVSVQ